VGGNIRCWTYETGARKDGRPGTESVQIIHQWHEPLDQLGIAIPEVIKCLSLLLKYRKDGLGGIAAIDLRGEGVTEEILPSLSCILGQSRIEDGFEVRGSGGSITSGEHGIVGGILMLRVGREGRGGLSGAMSSAFLLNPMAVPAAVCGVIAFDHRASHRGGCGCHVTWCCVCVSCPFN
jgi:hypothetical protein